MKVKRFIAMFIDLLAIILFEIIFYSLLGHVIGNDYVSAAVAYFIALTLLALLQSIWDGKTIGKKMVQLTVASDSEKQLTFATYWLRLAILYVFTFISAGFIHIANVICILIRKDNKAIHDLIVHTHVRGDV